METDRIKWNERFESQDSFLGKEPSPFLVAETERILQLAPGRRALDIACGEGRNSLYLARMGFQVTGLDISDAGLDKASKRAADENLQVVFERVDLEGYCITDEFDLIINFNFLLRELIPEQVRALAPGGVLIIDTIMESPDLVRTHNPAYLLRSGELRELFESFDGEILFSGEIYDGEMPTARLLFRKAP